MATGSGVCTPRSTRAAAPRRGSAEYEKALVIDPLSLPAVMLTRLVLRTPDEGSKLRKDVSETQTLASICVAPARAEADIRKTPKPVP